MGLWRKAIAGNEWRKTRLHDQKGNLVPLRELIYLPKVCLRTLQRVAFGAYAVEPWWTFSLVARVERILRPNMRVLEFGSGQSTLWLAERVGTVVSIESDAAWQARVRSQADKLGLSNIDLRLRAADSYADCSEFTDRSFDFCVIDGMLRGVCAETALPKMRPGGWIYLDNSDNDMTFPPDGKNIRSAELFLASRVPSDRIESFTGFTTTMLGAHQGMLFHLPE
jgi:predicted O-methyltransferase YrrM